jgi:hypothetical protein
VAAALLVLCLLSSSSAADVRLPLLSLLLSLKAQFSAMHRPTPEQFARSRFDCGCRFCTTAAVSARPLLANSRAM